MRNFGLALTASAAWLGSAGAVQAQTAQASWVHKVLAEWEAIQVREGWSPQGEARPGALATGAEARLDFPLAAGTAYRFVVICEPRCGAGDVELLDPAGARAGDSKALVEMPRLEVTPAAAGIYRLRVAMTDCGADICAWSARLYAQSPAKPRRR